MTDLIERELSLPASVADVWRAITDPQWLSGWLADDVELELLPGGAQTPSYAPVPPFNP